MYPNRRINLAYIFYYISTGEDCTTKQIKNKKSIFVARLNAVILNRLSVKISVLSRVLFFQRFGQKSSDEAGGLCLFEQEGVVSIVGFDVEILHVFTC